MKNKNFCARVVYKINFSLALISYFNHEINFKDMCSKERNVPLSKEYDNMKDFWTVRKCMLMLNET